MHFSPTTASWYLGTGARLDQLRAQIVGNPQDLDRFRRLYREFATANPRDIDNALRDMLNPDTLRAMRRHFAAMSQRLERIEHDVPDCVTEYGRSGVIQVDELLNAALVARIDAELQRRAAAHASGFSRFDTSAWEVRVAYCQDLARIAEPYGTCTGSVLTARELPDHVIDPLAQAVGALEQRAVGYPLFVGVGRFFFLHEEEVPLSELRRQAVMMTLSALTACRWEIENGAGPERRSEPPAIVIDEHTVGARDAVSHALLNAQNSIREQGRVIASQADSFAVRFPATTRYSQLLTRYLDSQLDAVDALHRSAGGGLCTLSQLRPFEAPDDSALRSLCRGFQELEQGAQDLIDACEEENLLNQVEAEIASDDPRLTSAAELVRAMRAAQGTSDDTPVAQFFSNVRGMLGPNPGRDREALIERARSLLHEDRSADYFAPAPAPLEVAR